MHGADTALPVWIAFQRKINRGMPVFDDLQPAPDGVVWVDVDPDWGVLASEGTGIKVPHLVGTQPTVTAPPPGSNAEELLLESSF